MSFVLAKTKSLSEEFKNKLFKKKIIYEQANIKKRYHQNIEGPNFLETPVTHIVEITP
jgi:hypothetical protein